MKKYLIFLAIISIFFSNFAFGQELPKTTDEVKEIGEKALEKTPEALKDSFKEAEPIWSQFWSQIKKWAKIIWNKTYYFLNKEVEQRKPAVKEEFKRETRELKEEITKEAPSLWQRFKNLIYWRPNQ